MGHHPPLANHRAPPALARPNPPLRTHRLLISLTSPPRPCGPRMSGCPRRIRIGKRGGSPYDSGSSSLGYKYRPTPGPSKRLTFPLVLSSRSSRSKNSPPSNPSRRHTRNPNPAAPTPILSSGRNFSRESKSPLRFAGPRRPVLLLIHERSRGGLVPFPDRPCRGASPTRRRATCETQRPWPWLCPWWRRPIRFVEPSDLHTHVPGHFFLVGSHRISWFVRV